MKAILIDSTNRTITQAKQENMSDCYELLNCNLVQSGGYLPNEDCIYVDDEGMYNQPKDDNNNLNGFEMYFPDTDYRQLFVGNGLIVGTDREGNTVACKTKIEDIKGNVRFVKIKGE